MPIVESGSADPAKTWRLVGIGVLAAIAVVAGYKLLSEAAALAPSLPPTEARLEAELAEHPYFQALKQTFPADYARMRAQMAADVDGGADMETARSRSVARTRDFILAKAAATAAAPTPQLRAMFGAERDVIRQLQTVDVEHCAEYGEVGHRPERHASETTERLLTVSARARLMATRAGLDAPVRRAPLSTADFPAMYAAMRAAGASERFVELMFSGRIEETDMPTRCAGSVAFYEALMALPPEQGARWMAFISGPPSTPPTPAPFPEGQP